MKFFSACVLAPSFFDAANRLMTFDVSVLWGEFAGGGGRLAKRVESSIKIDSQHMVFSAESVRLIT